MDIARLEDRIRSCVHAGHVLGLSLAIIQGEAVTYTGAFGRTSVEPEGVPVTPTTLFDVASISKVLCATMIMRLVERGTLDLDEAVLTYLPGFTFSDQALGRKVTLRQLLSHTSGLPAAGKDWGPCGRDALRRFVWEQLVHYSFIAEPGRVHQYANSSFCLAGYVAEAATGRYYRELVREHVLDPLGMTRTTFDRAAAMTYRLALPHKEDEDGQVRTLHRWTDNASGEPSGFAIAPVLDLANLAIAHLNQGRFGGEAFLSPGAIATMHAPHADRRVTGASHPVAHLYEGYGLGLMTGTYRGARLVRHGGISQSFNNFLQLLPDAGVGFVLLTNYGDEEAVAELVFAIHDELLGLPDRGAAARVVLVPPAPVAPDRDRWPLYQGSYLSVQRGRLARVGTEGERLVLEQDGRSRLLAPLADGKYFYEEEGLRIPVEFSSADGVGHPAEYIFVGGNPYRRLVLDPGFRPDPESWTRFVGAYRDPSNVGEGAVWRIRNAGGRLRVTGDWADDVCVPLGPDSFLSGIGLLEFDAAGGVLTVGKATRYHRIGEPS